MHHTVTTFPKATSPKDH